MTAPTLNSAEMARILDDALAGSRMSETEAAALFRLTGRDIWKVAAAADERREEVVGDTVTYVRNMNLHMTNICKNRCGLCAFGRKPTDPDAFCFTDEEFREHARDAAKKEVTEVCYLAGVHPGFTIENYETMIRTLCEEIPGVHVHGCSPDEIAFAAQRSGLTTKETLIRLKEAGLGSVQGTAAEILVDSVRKVICEKKIPTEEWVRIIREAHEVGFKATSTIMYGSVETPEERAHHLSILRDLQDETQVFTELVPLAFLHHNTPLEKDGTVTYGSTGREDILLTAVSRLFLDNMKNIQVPWSKIGQKMTQLGLMSGGNDVGGTMFVDSLSRTAGAGEEADFFDPKDMQYLCDDMGRKLARRDTLYNILE
ncbi:MAG TPA: 5-amino-6-(D-ribitylamino)uracil--L-tyrosine 4-hydroxyphenyl transferase CofH [Methanocorpusculum sp.]|nr:5-amino-6-(D-ribitylamino)uracil--L-tyrosine 4-hydroxyphenyl transferase CofH [Methanocorpusculum sp.]HJK60562.1 5-amino-6-(D-ribitylamino)uracil--L-tyrosine 4-hydroxyphenyl transferase CofH [Methanocorpusculum sp.]